MRQTGVTERPGTAYQGGWLPVARRAAALLTAGGALAVMAGCSGPAPGQAALPVITARSVPGLGTILVNAKGHALYMFVPDGHRKVTCTNECAAVWPPVMLPAGSAAKAGAGARPALLGSDPDPSGGRVVTYAGWPLYTYVSDIRPGRAAGQALDLNGGLWYVMRPSGAIVRSAR
ncbi:MAG: COG4315 family predicted lipoprotein [Streptosporangiaceae bacterium]